MAGNEESKDDETAPDELCANAPELRWEVTRGPHSGERFSHRVVDGESVLLVGRQQRCWLRLRRDLEVSGVHAEIRVTSASCSRPLTWRVVVVDRQSTNGSKLNGTALVAQQEYALSPQDLLQFGKSALRFDVESPRAIPGDAKCDATPETTAEVHEMIGGDEAAVTDENAFEDEAHRRPDGKRQREREPPNSPAIGGSASSDCMVCGISLASFSVLKRQFHVNACLDGGPLATLERATAGAAPRASKKARRQLQQRQLNGGADDDMTMALTLSKSLLDPEQEVNMKMALLHSELAKLDAEISKLSKRRAGVVKKLERLEKTKRKVRKSRVLGPGQALRSLDVALALAVLFPESHRSSDHPRATPRESKLSSRRPSVKGIGMWARASQWVFLQTEDELYTTSILRRFPSAAAATAAAAATPRAATREMAAVPDAVKRVFPNWRENLEFMQQQSVEDLTSALDEMQSLREQRRAETAEPDAELEPGQATRRDDEDEACAYFENEIRRLLAAARAPRGETMDEPARVEGSSAVNSPSIISIPDSSDEEQGKEPKELDGEGEDCSGDRDVVADDSDPQPTTTSESPQASAVETTSASPQSTLESRLLTALKAHTTLYESVLLLHPIDFNELHRYVTQEAGIPCAKQALAEFCDRHGITFKHA
ncbi:hypothetical protein P43SY_006693 [Pythium insidiosum]|uniref:Structure-specific endonuclease subunit SLX4 n=1 Tax=Pythium insidiosum TaxID=114742 RepID=A0AAD5QCN9_PYTIN|nr:hypothetical protein P43SY_006693 [Pythium insidiosum]